MEHWIGNKVKDEVTGFVGKVTAVAVYATGETRLLVENIDTTGRPIEWWFDAKRTIAVE